MNQNFDFNTGDYIYSFYNNYYFNKNVLYTIRDLHQQNEYKILALVSIDNKKFIFRIFDYILIQHLNEKIVNYFPRKLSTNSKLIELLYKNNTVD